MICKECNSEMRLDDKDIDFKGKYDNYWVCDNCITSCKEEVRFSQKFREVWSYEKNGSAVEEVVKYNINRGK